MADAEANRKEAVDGPERATPDLVYSVLCLLGHVILDPIANLAVGL